MFVKLKFVDMLCCACLNDAVSTLYHSYLSVLGSTVAPGSSSNSPQQQPPQPSEDGSGGGDSDTTTQSRRSGLTRLPSLVENRQLNDTLRVADPQPGEEPLPRGRPRSFVMSNSIL